MEKVNYLTSTFDRHFLIQVLKPLLPLAALSCAGVLFLLDGVEQHTAADKRAHENIAVRSGRDAIENTFAEVRHDIRLITGHPALERYLDTKSTADLQHFVRDIPNLASNSRVYDRIRWLDQTGNELIRIDFNQGRPNLVAAGEFQSPNDRHYLAIANTLHRGELYIAPLVINAEPFSLEQPQRPVLRLVEPIFDTTDTLRGIIVVDYFAQDLLARFDKASANTDNHILLVNSQGLRLNKPLPNRDRNFAFGPSTPSFISDRPAVWQRISTAEDGQFEADDGLWTFCSIQTTGITQGPDSSTPALSWKIVGYLPDNLVYGRQLAGSFYAALASILLLELLGCVLFARLRTNNRGLQAQLLSLSKHKPTRVDDNNDRHRQAEQHTHLLDAALSATAEAVVITDYRGVAVWANPAFSTLTGYTLEGIQGKHTADLLRVGPQSETFYRAINHCIKSKRMWRGEIASTQKDGTMCNEALTITPIRNAENSVTHFIAILENITERKQAETHLINLTRVYTMLSNINQAIVHVRDTGVLLREICRISIEEGGFSMAWIGLPDPAGGAIKPRAFAGIDEETLEQLNNTKGAATLNAYAPNLAYSENRNVGSNDIEHDPRTTTWRHKALALGYRSMLAIPLTSNGQVYGVYVLYARIAGFFTNDEIKLLDDLANDIAFALEVADSDAERRRMENQWRHAAAVFDNTREGVMLTDTSLRIYMVNRAFSDITGYSEAEIIDNTPAILSSGRHDAAFYADIWSNLLSCGHWQGEIWNKRKNGTVYPELLSISSVVDGGGKVSGYVGVFADISELKASEAQMEFLAHHDPLTQLPNRLLLISRLEHGIEQAKRKQGCLAVLMLDLDRFKNINDSFGHPTGDELLQHAARRLIQHLRNVDTVTRLGGDEFTVVLEDISNAEDAGRIATYLIAALNEPWHLSNSLEVCVSTSIGISLFPQNGQSPAELLQQADAALYHAKAGGRGCFRYYTEQMTQSARERIALEGNLRRALDQQEFRLFYQPQIDIKSGRIIGAEALLRWQNPEQGLITPGHFMSAIESTGLINSVGTWVLSECCAQGTRWMAAGLPSLTLAVNVSAHQFLQRGLVDAVSHALAQSGFPATQLELEITESSLMDREIEAVETMNQLRELGVRLAIDDFGTGYSSLAYLKRFPLDVLKIDKSFVEEIPDNQDDKEIAATIIAMAHILRFKVLAEGVETEAQLAFLKDHGCDAYQGYWKSPPLPADQFAAMLLADFTQHEQAAH